jgi:5'-nucleotidase
MARKWKLRKGKVGSSREGTKNIMRNYSIFITNDDGIESPGLRAAVESVLDIGTVTVVAPSHQQTGTGRGLIGDMRSSLQRIDYQVNGSEIRAYHCDCSPALIVNHSLKTIFRENRPDLLISGINYGENLGINITHSGTIGAALEASSSGITSIAISKQTDIASHNKYTDQDWTAAVYFLNRFARILLKEKLQTDVNVLKIDIPSDATPSTKWKITKLAKAGYYSRPIENATAHSKIGDGRTIIKIDKENLNPETDIYAFAIDKLVSVTPLSVDLTSRVKPSDLQVLLGENT